MSEWIVINLPWYADTDEYPEYIEYPDHSQQVKELVGTEYEELKEKLETAYDEDSPVYLPREEFVEQVRLGNPKAVMISRYRELHQKVQDWENEQPDNKEIDIRNEQLRKEFKARQALLSFRDSEWCEAGVLIEFDSEDGTPVQQLLGHMNTLGGVCDDCRGISNDTIIKRCKVVWVAQCANCYGSGCDPCGRGNCLVCNGKG